MTSVDERDSDATWENEQSTVTIPQRSMTNSLKDKSILLIEI